MIAPGKVTIPWSTRMIDQLVRPKDHRRMDIEIGSGHAGPAGTPRVVKVHDAKTRLSELLRDVEQGAEITISRGSRAVARLVPMPQQPRARPMGFVDYELPDSFFDELPEEQLAAWER